MNRLTITPKLTLIFVLFAGVVLLVLGLTAYFAARNSLYNATVSELLSSSLEKESALNDWMDASQLTISDLANHAHLREIVSSFVTSAPKSAAAVAAPAAIASNLANWVGEGKRYLYLEVIDADTGKVIGATDAEQAGKFREAEPYFIEGKRNPNVQNPAFDLALRRAVMTVGAPLYAPDGELVAVLGGVLNMDEMTRIIERRTGLRQTDDAFLVNTDNLFVTQPHLIADPAVLQRGLRTEAIDRCLAYSSGILQGPDYRSIPAIIAYRWLAERQLCLITKIDQREAYAAADELGMTLAISGAFVLLVTSLLAFGVARSITSPIKQLAVAAKEFGEGQLDRRVALKTQDEIGVLANEFNKMASALQAETSQLRRQSEQLFLLSVDLICVAGLDGFFRVLNPSWGQVLGYSATELQGRPLVALVHPDDRQATIDAMASLASSQGVVTFENRYRCKDGAYRWLQWNAVGVPGEGLIYAIAHDVTERKEQEIELAQRSADLARSNAELERFAYVASHDLQEPLRMVTSYMQLVERRYKGKLDDDADEFIGFAVDGANRMKALINDLLAYSRVGSGGKAFAPTDCEEALTHSLTNLQVAIAESSATVTHDPLPTVLADENQLVQLLQNLIGNAIKFRGEAAPQIHLSATRAGEEWAFSVRDNGIGIEPEYFERIFVVFQRLHGKSEYSGTGIGLAVCKKIVERHNGRMWVGSAPGAGSTFYFTLPVMQPETAAIDTAYFRFDAETTTTDSENNGLVSEKELHHDRLSAHQAD